MISDEKKLDNPVWFALAETHQAMAIEFSGVKLYNPSYCPFGAYDETEDISRALLVYAQLANDFFIVGNKPAIPQSLHLKKELVCAQMNLASPVVSEQQNEIVQLTATHHQQLFHLVNLVQPGYFREKTALMGNYYGIFDEEQLVAVSGERMQMNDWIEISAVVTHPGHTGKSYAKQLVAHTANNIFRQNKMPFLHVAATNTAAINLYEKLGFTSRRLMSFWHLDKQSG